MHYTSATVQKK